MLVVRAEDTDPESDNMKTWDDIIEEQRAINGDTVTGLIGAAAEAEEKFSIDVLEAVALNRSLNETLAKCGLTTRPGEFHSTKDILKSGEVVFSGTAGQVWSWLNSHKIG